MGKIYVELANKSIAAKKFTKAQLYLDNVWMLAYLTPGLEATQDKLDSVFGGSSAVAKAKPATAKPAQAKAKPVTVAKKDNAKAKAEKAKKEKQLAAARLAKQKAEKQAADRRRRFAKRLIRDTISSA
mgnify:CR=1 FL=1